MCIQPGCKGSLGENGYMPMDGWVPSLSTWNYQIVHWLYPNTKHKFQKRERNVHTFYTHVCVLSHPQPLWSHPWVLKPDPAVSRAVRSAPARPLKLSGRTQAQQPEKNGPQFPGSRHKKVQGWCLGHDSLDGTCQCRPAHLVPSWSFLHIHGSVNMLLLPFSPPGSSDPRMSQARTLERVFIPFSRGSSWPRHQTLVSCIGRWVLYHWAPNKLHIDFIL